MYYDALEASDQSGDSTAFVEFSLSMIHAALQDFVDVFRPDNQTTESRLEVAREHFSEQFFSRKQYIDYFKSISTATASRDLKQGVEQELLQKTGEQSTTVYSYTAQS